MQLEDVIPWRQNRAGDHQDCLLPYLLKDALSGPRPYGGGVAPSEESDQQWQDEGPGQQSGDRTKSGADVTVAPELPLERSVNEVGRHTVVPQTRPDDGRAAAELDDLFGPHGSAMTDGSPKSSSELPRLEALEDTQW